jgi:hypothetical protein
MHRPSACPLRTQGGSRLNAAKGREQLTIDVLGVVTRNVALNVEAVRCCSNGPVNQVGQGSTNRHRLGGRDIGNELKIFHFSMVSTKLRFCRKWVSELFYGTMIIRTVSVTEARFDDEPAITTIGSPDLA